MRMLIMNDETRKAIAEAIAKARENVIPWSIGKDASFQIENGATLDLEMRDEIAAKQQQSRTQRVFIQDGFQACISFEEQPAGLMKHLSVSIHDPEREGILPHEMAVHVICQLFGIEYADSTWFEEYAPNQFAVNVLTCELLACQRHPDSGFEWVCHHCEAAWTVGMNKTFTPEFRPRSCVEQPDNRAAFAKREPMRQPQSIPRQQVENDSINDQIQRSKGLHSQRQTDWSKHMVAHKVGVQLVDPQDDRPDIEKIDPQGEPHGEPK